MTASQAKPPKLDAGAGFSTAIQNPPDGPKDLEHGAASQVSRSMAMGSYMLSGIMAVNMSQAIGAPLYLINRDWYNAWIAFTKQSIGLLFITMTQFWAPTTVIISGDKSMRGQLQKTVQGDLFCDFPYRLVMMANHQIYTDWLYLWWIAYANGMHGRIYIVLKESLKRIPLIGWGMQFSKFIFLKRNWEADKPNLAKHMQGLNNSKEPMWLTLFPEGTNLAPSTRRASARWAEKQKINDMKHTLLPRSTGLQFILQQLKDTTDWIYDCTIAYEGVPRGQYAQDIYTLRAQYAGGRRPKSVSMHFRRFKLSTIPLDDEDAFAKWLAQRWQEKDNLLEYYMEHGEFPADTGREKLPDGRIRAGAGHIQTEVRANRWYEFLQTFAPMGLFAMVLYSFYGALPQKIVKALQRQALGDKVDMLKRVGQQMGGIKSRPGGVKVPMTITNQQLVTLKKAMAQKNITINQQSIQKALDAGFFKPKNGLPVNGDRQQLALTDDALKQFVANAAVDPKSKTGLTAAEKRFRALQRSRLQGASKENQSPSNKPASTNATVSKIGQKNVTLKPAQGAARPGPATKPPQAVTKPKPSTPIIVTTPVAATKPPSTLNGVVKKSQPPKLQPSSTPTIVTTPAVAATKSTSTLNGVVKKSQPPKLHTSSTTTKPTTATTQTRAQPINPPTTNGSASAAKPATTPAKRAIPKLRRTSSADTGSVSSNSTIPKLEIRSQSAVPTQRLGPPVSTSTAKPAATASKPPAPTKPSAAKPPPPKLAPKPNGTATPLTKPPPMTTKNPAQKPPPPKLAPKAPPPTKV